MTDNTRETAILGGGVANPSYEDVCAGRTRHAEVVRISSDLERLKVPAA